MRSHYVIPFSNILRGNIFFLVLFSNLIFHLHPEKISTPDQRFYQQPTLESLSFFNTKKTEIGRWSEEFGVSGMDSVVSSLAIDSQGILYAGGEFITIDGKVVNHIAKWDGNIWSPLGEGRQDPVINLAVNSRGVVYTDQLSYSTEGTPTIQIIQWDGSSWTPAGDDLGTVLDTVVDGRDSNPNISVLAVDKQDFLYVGGYLYMLLPDSDRYFGFVLRWDGTKWEFLGSGMDHTVYSLAVNDQGIVYAGGEFSTAGGTPANRVAAWDGKDWYALGAGFANYPTTLVVNGEGNLFATISDGRNSVMEWDGESWNRIGAAGGEVSAVIFDMAATQEDDLVVAGSFTSIDGVPANNIARWDGSSWSALDGGMNREVFALAADAENHVYAGGYFSHAGDQTAEFIARWDGIEWSGLNNGTGNGMNMPVNALQADQTGLVYAGGIFTSAGGVEVNRVASWDGTSWKSLGEGIEGYVHALAVDSQDNLYAAGDFTSIGGVNANHISVWDGITWSPLGSGIDGMVINELIVDHQDRLYAAGAFYAAGGLPANNIAMWDGIAWSALGDGLNEQVNALAVDEDDNLFAAGWFTTAGGIDAQGIAMWDGKTWSGLGNGLNDIQALAVDVEGHVYAGGSFTFIGEKSINRIALWDGETWNPLGNGMEGDEAISYPSVTTLVVDEYGNLFAGGYFNSAGGKPANNIAVWDGTEWNTLDDGIEFRAGGWGTSPISAMIIDREKNLYVGGVFIVAGGNSSVNIAKWVMSSESLSDSEIEENADRPTLAPTFTVETSPVPEEKAVNTSTPDKGESLATQETLEESGKMQPFLVLIGIGGLLVILICLVVWYVRRSRRIG
jgi:hypothetical protein